MKGSVTVDIDNYINRPGWLDKNYRPIGGDSEKVSDNGRTSIIRITTYWIDNNDSIVETHSYRFIKKENT